METIVIGHKNPDMDSICSAIGYARLKQLQGIPNVIPARAGNTNARIDFVLQKFGVESPVFISDLSPRAEDVMHKEVICLPKDAPVYNAIQTIEEKLLRALPVIDSDSRFLGLLSMFKISHYLFPPREEANSARVVQASLADIIQTFQGVVVTGAISAEDKAHLLMVGGMSQESFTTRLGQYTTRDIILIVGDREDIQAKAIQAGVGAVVITGDMPVRVDIHALASKSGVPIISSPHDTASTVLLARGAARVGRMIATDNVTFTPDTLLDDIREIAAHSTAFSFPILDNDGKLVGILSKSDFLLPIQRQLILVDHNELSQAVNGADKVPIIEILDHHRLGGFATDLPIHFWNNPVGSTSTIVATCYRNSGVPIPREIAGLLMAGLISDTLHLSSPTTTPTDREILAQLSQIAGVDSLKLAEEIFSVGSPLLTLTPEQATTADCKEYHENGRRFTVSQIEELSFSNFEKKEPELLEALDAHVRAQQLYFAALLVTDINEQTSLLLVSGAPEFLEKIDYPQCHPQIWELSGVVSRKKQLLPYLLKCLEGIRKH
jgi:manganese-dependent inorganic pyrophosphatase